MKSLYVILMLICAIGLTACSDEPSKSDVKKAMEESIKRRSPMLVGRQVTPNISIKDVKCEPIKEKEIYECRVDGLTEVKEMELKEEGVFVVTLTKVDGKWHDAGF